MAFELVALVRVAEESLEVGLIGVAADPNIGRWLQGGYQNVVRMMNLKGKADLVGRGRLDECAAVAKNELEVGLREVLLDLDRADLVLVLFRFRSLLDPVNCMSGRSDTSQGRVRTGRKESLFAS